MEGPKTAAVKICFGPADGRRWHPFVACVTCVGWAGVDIIAMASTKADAYQLLFGIAPVSKNAGAVLLSSRSHLGGAFAAPGKILYCQLSSDKA